MWRTHSFASVSNSDIIDGDIRFGKAISDWSYFNVRYRYENMKIDNLKLAASEVFQQGEDKISAIGLGLTYDTRNNFIQKSNEFQDLGIKYSKLKKVDNKYRFFPSSNTETLKNDLPNTCIPLVVDNVLISVSKLTSKFYPEPV